MAIINDIREAVNSAVSKGTAAARSQGAALHGDFESLVKPQLEDIYLQVAAIASDYIEGNILKDQAKDDLQTQCDRVQPIVLGVAELALLAVQSVINAILDALKSAANKAAGVALI
jgi:hypothetical protein